MPNQGVEHEAMLRQLERHRRQEQELLEKIARKNQTPGGPSNLPGVSPISHLNVPSAHTPSPLSPSFGGMLRSPGGDYLSSGVSTPNHMNDSSELSCPPLKRKRTNSDANSSNSQDNQRERAARLTENALFHLNELMQHMKLNDSTQITHNSSALFSSYQYLARFAASIQDSKVHDLPSETNLEDTSLEDFTLLDLIGTGTFGKVRLCKYNQSGEFFCIKSLNKAQVVRLKQQEHVRNEKLTLSQCRHPFIVNLYTTFQTDSDIHFVMEYVSGGELFTFIRNQGGLDANTARIYAAEIVLVIEYLHQRHIIHRDLKPENLLVDKRGHLKLTDFGFAKTVTDKTWTMCGTPEYIAPEIIQGKGHDRAVDWWSLGILIFEMLVGYPPFHGDNNYAVFENVLNGVLNIPTTVDPLAADLISKLLVADITRRLGCIRGGAASVKAHPWFATIDWNALLQKNCDGPIDPKTASVREMTPDGKVNGPSPIFQGDQDIFKGF